MPPNTAQSPEWRVLVIDDEADIREILQVVLEDAGFQVEAAENGEIGLDRCQAVRPHIVITDIRMPGIDGIRVLEEVKNKFPEIEVIVITAFSDMEVAIRALQLDASDFITKPINETALEVALNRAKDRYLSKKEIREYTALLEQQNAKTLQELIGSHVFRDKLIEYSMDGILGCDETGQVIIFNQSLQQMLGYSRETDFKALTLADVLPSDNYQLFFDALDGPGYGGRDRLFLFETELAAESGDRVPMQVSATRMFEAASHAGLVCFFRDLREIRRLEQELADQGRILHQDKMMSLGRLAASIVHEINNPLSGMLNYMHLMKRILDRGPVSGKTHEEFQQYLTLVESETSRCSKIVSSLLSFARTSQPVFLNIQVSELLNRCVLLSQHKLKLQHIDCRVSIADDLPPIYGDFNQLQQCIINLIFNAVDAMPDGGKLEISAEAGQAGDRLVIRVRDSGPGIPESDLPRIFEPFFSTKDAGYGVGLGLSTVYGIVKHHEGSITAANEAAGGACFTLELPAAKNT
ncbi:MAG: response regulator [Desulfobacterales bacterium]